MKTQDRSYQAGFSNYFSTEAVKGALPIGQNSPQKPPFGLVAELISGTAFTAARSENQRTWMYRIRPSVTQGPYQDFKLDNWKTAPDSTGHVTPRQLRWNAPSLEGIDADFIEGVQSVLTAGSVDDKNGSAVHLYRCNRSMGDRSFCNADGDLLIVPQSGRLTVTSELGVLDVEPTEIVVIPRGIKFKVDMSSAHARGYMLEVYGNHFQLPELGPIGSSGLANQRDFLSPVAHYEDKKGSFELITKYAGKMFSSALANSPFDVVAWHGNYCPYKYDLKRFNTINTVSFDHPDPSIFTVLTSPSDHPGVANVDFVIFPPRWMVAENTFRPPYYHRNVMSEYMGLIHGVYDAKPGSGFEPGGGSLHSCMSPHGPDAVAFEAASDSELKPEYQANTLAFMFESYQSYRITDAAFKSDDLQKDYESCWAQIKPRFSLES